MAKRERKAWLVVSPTRMSPVKNENGCFLCYSSPYGAMDWALLGGEEVVRCTITWDDGKPEKAAEKRKDKRAVQEP